MLTTEVQRIVLLVLLGVMGYALVYTWDRDYGRRAAEPAPDAAGAGDAPPASLPIEPDAPPPPTVADVPGEELAAPARSGAAETEEADASRLVHVLTPTLEVWIDRQGGDIVRAQLPQYPQSIGGDKPVRLLDRRSDHIYVAQSGLIGRDGPDRPGARPLYSASASDYSTDQGVLEVVLRHQAGQMALVKRYSFDAAAYVVSVDHEIDNRSDTEFRARLFAQLKRDATRPDGSEGFGMGPRPYVGAAFTTPDSRYEKVDFDDLDDEQFRVETAGGWAAILQHYFLAAWVGDPIR